MFTGIVEEIGTVESVTGNRLRLRARITLEGTRPGDSIAINGVDLTVVDRDAETMSFEVMPETLRRTNLGELRPGHRVNLERALALGQRMGGHIVQGHVEGTGRILSHTPEQDALLLRFSAPPQLLRYIVPKGAIAVDGISLTVVDCNDTSFSVSLVAYTQEHTTLAQKPPGATVNLETDILGRYIEKLLLGGRSTLAPG